MSLYKATIKLKPRDFNSQNRKKLKNFGIYELTLEAFVEIYDNEFTISSILAVKEDDTVLPKNEVLKQFPFLQDAGEFQEALAKSYTSSLESGFSDNWNIVERY